MGSVRNGEVLVKWSDSRWIEGFRWRRAAVDCGCLRCGLFDLGAVPFAWLLRERPGCLVVKEPMEMNHRAAIRGE